MFSDECDDRTGSAPAGVGFTASQAEAPGHGPAGPGPLSPSGPAANQVAAGVTTDPTLFEYLRRSFDIPSHQVLPVNGEDRPQEEFFTFGAGDHFGVEYRSEMLSLHRHKLNRTAQQLAEATLPDDQLLRVQQERQGLLTRNPRGARPAASPQVQAFWARWRQDFGDSGLKNPRGDRLLTELSVRALAELKPRFLMVKCQDPDHVHWGNASHYTRAIVLQRLVSAAEADPVSRDNTIFVITPDCGRDANPGAEMPFQHHFNSRSAHETWAVIFGPGIGKGTVDRPVDQSAIAPTIAAAMGFSAHPAEGRAVDEIFL